MNTSHQDAIAEIIYRLIKMPINLRVALVRGNPFDKLLRSYSEFTSKGDPLYRNKRCFEFYPFSVNAQSYFRKNNTLDGLHAEHEIPLSIIKEKLLENCSWSLLRVKRYLAENNKVVVITKDEQRLIDSKFKSSMPADGKSRIEYFRIKIAKRTKKH
jgi:hypothetical protein